MLQKFTSKFKKENRSFDKNSNYIFELLEFILCIHKWNNITFDWSHYAESKSCGKSQMCFDNNYGRERSDLSSVFMTHCLENLKILYFTLIHEFSIFKIVVFTCLIYLQKYRPTPNVSNFFSVQIGCCVHVTSNLLDIKLQAY